MADAGHGWVEPLQQEGQTEPQPPSSRIRAPHLADPPAVRALVPRAGSSNRPQGPPPASGGHRRTADAGGGANRIRQDTPGHRPECSSVARPSCGDKRQEGLGGAHSPPPQSEGHSVWIRTDRRAARLDGCERDHSSVLGPGAADDGQPDPQERRPDIPVPGQPILRTRPRKPSCMAKSRPKGDERHAGDSGRDRRSVEDGSALAIEAVVVHRSRQGRELPQTPVSGRSGRFRRAR